MATSYSIKKGDTLSGIASQYNTTVSALASANGISNPNLIIAGNSLTIPDLTPTTPVPTNSVQNTAPVTIPQQTPTVDPNALVASANATNVTNAQGEQSGAATAVDNTFNDLTSLSQKLEGATAFAQNKENELGIPQLSKDIMELQNMARAKNLEYEKAFNTIEDKQVPMGVIVGEQASLQRRQAVDIAVINSNIQAKSGQLAYAQNLVERAVALEFDPIKAQIETKKLILDKQYNTLTVAEQKLADAKKKDYDFKLAQIDIQAEDRKNTLNLINTAAANGASNAQIKLLTENAKTPEEFFALGGAELLAAGDTEIIKIGGANVMINKRTGDIIKNFGQAGDGSGGGGTQFDKVNQTYSIINSSIVPGATVAGSDVPVLDANGFITPQGLNSIISFGRTSGIDRKDIISQYSSYIAKDKNGAPLSGYGLTAKEKAEFTG